jgi:hypothetical protein
MSEEDVPGDGPARRRREEGCRREEAIRELLKRHGEKRLTVVDVVAWELGVSCPTMYRLIVAYRAKGTRYKKAPISAALPYRTCVPPDETRRRSNQAA